MQKNMMNQKSPATAIQKEKVNKIVAKKTAMNKPPKAPVVK